MASNLNEAGRGINCVVVNPDTKEVVRVARFDTFASGLLHIIVLHYICSNAVKNITIMDRHSIERITHAGHSTPFFIFDPVRLSHTFDLLT